jgi:hypothetical protein
MPRLETWTFRVPKAEFVTWAESKSDAHIDAALGLFGDMLFETHAIAVAVNDDETAEAAVDTLMLLQGHDPEPPYDDEHYPTMLLTYDEVRDVLVAAGGSLDHIAAEGGVSLTGEGVSS